MKLSRYLSQLLVVGAVAGVVACRDEPRPIDQDRSTGPGMTEAGRNDGATRVGAAIEATDVRMALTMEGDLDASDIDVDVDHTTRVVSLTGFVPTAEQRTRAEEIARSRAEDYRIDNQLEVRARQ
jgi:osmotically-inducible protein OsmY